VQSAGGEDAFGLPPSRPAEQQNLQARQVTETSLDGGRQEDEIDRFWRSKIAPEVQGIATIIKKVVKNCDQSGQPILWQAASNGKHWHTTCKAG